LHIVLLVLVTAVLLVVVWHQMTRVRALPVPLSGWGTAGKDDPRVPVAAMLHAIASESGPVARHTEQQILGLLTTRMGMDRGLAKLCLTSGRRLDLKLRGGLNTRLHQLVTSIERNCTLEERRDVVEMLRAVAGSNTDRLGNVRESLGRVTATLLHG